MNRSHCLFALLLAGTPAAAQQAPPARTVTIEATTDSGLIRAAGAVRHLPDGRVLVNDPQMRRLIALNPDFKTFTRLADTAAGAQAPYTSAFVALIKHQGDSSLFVDRDANAMIVVDPQGKLGRVLAHPKSSDLLRLMVPFCECGVDPKGRLIYRGALPIPNPTTPTPSDGSNKPVLYPLPDSAPIVRADFDTRTVDTIAMMKIPSSTSVMISPSPGRTIGTSMTNPLPTTDEWALLPDGTVAIIRAQDYHIDWISPDGKKSSSPKMPFDWKPITHEQKVQLIDSLRVAYDARQAARPTPPPGSQPFNIPFVPVPPEEIGDFYPPIRAGQFRADPDGNVWILPSTSTLSASGTSGLAWDVVNRNGEIVERVKFPEGRNLAGFGKGGIIYMIYAPSPGKILLERARIIRQ
jgi:hypothetical protein